MKLILKDKKLLLPGVYTFVFEKPADLNFKAGQFMKYTLPHENVDERKRQRFFTISAAPFEGTINITTRILEQEGSSFKNALKNLEIGQAIEASGPFGSFTLDDPAKSYLFIAGGIGITPYRSILLELAHNKQPINVNLLYANKTPDGVVFKDELENLQNNNPNFKIQYVFDPQRIDKQLLNDQFSMNNYQLIYLSGPEPMVEGIEKILSEIGMAKEQIKTDYFPGYSSY